jgi:hypothetical protein
MDADTFHPATYGMRGNHPLGEVGRIVRAHPVTDETEAVRHELVTATVDADTLARWEQAIEEFRRTQMEMLAVFNEAEAAYEARVAAEEAIEQERWEAERAVAAAKFEAEREAREAIAEAEDGPREWVLVTKVADRGTAFRVRNKTIGFTVHHHTCAVLGRVLAPSAVSDEPVRLPTAVDWVLKPETTVSYSEIKPVKVCGRCASKVAVQVDFLRALQPRS